MAIYFSEAVSQLLDGHSVSLAILGRFEFLEGEERLWMGHGELHLDEVWKGTGEFVQLSSLSSGAGDVAQPVTFTLSGVSEKLMQVAVAGRHTIRGRRVTLSFQFFDSDNFKPIESKVDIWVGYMDRLTVEKDLSNRSLSLICEGLFTDRSKAPSGLYTDRDQNKRFPGDKGLKNVQGLIQKSVSWPTF